MKTMKISFGVPCFQLFQMAEDLAMLGEHLKRSGSKRFLRCPQGGK